MGSLIKHLATANLDDEKTDLQLNQKQIIGLYDLLLERINDLSTYVRSKVYQVFARLLSLDTKFPKQRLAMTRAAITALQDKAPSVRKSAIALLDKLVTSHPYFMHGGTLSLELWTTEYEKVVNKLKQVEETVGKSVEREASDDSDDEEEDGDEDTPKRKRQAK
jgi:condensin complex subunit 1